jgi:CheY-like chemotaxis protein
MNKASFASPLRVLVVDDGPDTTASFSWLLKIWGHSVRAAHNGPAALEVARACPPHVVLLDVALGSGMDGYDVARQLRALSNLEEPLLICMTGFGMEADRRHSQEAGFDYHLTKPANPEELQEILAGWKPRYRTKYMLLPRDERTSLASNRPKLALAPPARISEVAERRLHSHLYLALKNLSCAYHAGVLTLPGWLPTYYLKQLAQAAVAQIEGVERVDNQIEVLVSAQRYIGRA